MPGRSYITWPQGGGAIIPPPGGGTFTPIAASSAIGTIADGQNILVNGTFAPKPYAAKPRFWAPMETQFNPSTLGRVQAWNPNYSSAFMSFASSGGPTGLGCMTGSGSPGTGGTGIDSTWAIGYDVDNWTGYSAAPYALNSYGMKTRVSRSSLRHAMGFLLGDGGSPGQFNTKTYRAWARTGGIGSGIQGQGPDIYAPPCNGRLEVEGPTGWVDWSPSPDYNGDLLARTLYESLQDVWFKEEIKYVSNSNVSTADANFQWTAYAPGFSFPLSNVTRASSCVITSSSPQSTNPFEQDGNNEQQLIFDGIQGMTQLNGVIATVTAAGGSAGAWTATLRLNTSSFSAYTGGGYVAYMPWNFPNTSYELQTWKFLNANNSGLPGAVGGGGNILQSYPFHYVVDGTSSRANAPLGAYPQWAYGYEDDGWVWAVLTDTPTYYAGNSYREPQIPFQWGQSGTQTQIGIQLRKGQLARANPAYLWTTDNNDVPTLQGYVTWP